MQKCTRTAKSHVREILKDHGGSMTLELLEQELSSRGVLGFNVRTGHVLAEMNDIDFNEAFLVVSLKQ